MHAGLGLLSFNVNSPAKHVLHSPLPVASWYCPLWQFRQTVAPDKEYCPARQVGSHVDAVVAAVTVEYLPAAHSAHKALPVDALYLPGTQAVHSSPSDPVYPLLHLQLTRVPLPTAEYELDGHAMHAEAPASEYFPASQFVHVASDLAPVAPEIFPASQEEHKAVPVEAL